MRTTRPAVAIWLTPAPRTELCWSAGPLGGRVFCRREGRGWPPRPSLGLRACDPTRLAHLDDVSVAGFLTFAAGGSGSERVLSLGVALGILAATSSVISTAGSIVNNSASFL